MSHGWTNCIESPGNHRDIAPLMYGSVLLKSPGTTKRQKRRTNHIDVDMLPISKYQIKITKKQYQLN